MWIGEPVAYYGFIALAKHSALQGQIEQGIEVCQCMQLDLGFVKRDMRLGETVTDDCDHVSDERSRFAQSCHPRKTASTGGDQIFYQEDGLALDRTSFNALRLTVAFAFLTNEDGGFVQDISEGGAMGNAADGDAGDQVEFEL